MEYIHRIRTNVNHTSLIMTSVSRVNQRGKILLQEIADTGDWDFPSDHLKYGETFQHTLIKEYKVDTGLMLKPADEGNFRIKSSKTTAIKYFASSNSSHFFNHQHEKIWRLATQYVKEHHYE